MIKIDNTTQNNNFACCLYGCENWSLTLREERRLRVLEKRVLRRIFGPKRDKVTDSGENYTMSLNLKVSHPRCVVKIKYVKNILFVYSHKTQLNIKLSLLLYYNITTTCFGLNYRPSSGCI